MKLQNIHSQRIYQIVDMGAPEGILIQNLDKTISRNITHEKMKDHFQLVEDTTKQPKKVSPLSDEISFEMTENEKRVAEVMKKLKPARQIYTLDDLSEATGLKAKVLRRRMRQWGIKKPKAQYRWDDEREYLKAIRIIKENLENL